MESLSASEALASTQFLIQEHTRDNGGLTLEIRPVLITISPFSFIVDLAEKTSGNIEGFAVGPSGKLPVGQWMGYGVVQSEDTLTPTGTDERIPVSDFWCAKTKLPRKPAIFYITKIALAAFGLVPWRISSYTNFEARRN